MVAISLYKGNLHKVSDVPRRWPRPTSNISLKDFKILLRRRSRALARIRSSGNVAHASISNPASNLTPDDSKPDPIPKGNDLEKNHDGDHKDKDIPSTGPELPPQEDLKDLGEAKEVEMNEDALMKLVEKSDAIVEEEGEKEETAKKEGKTEVVNNSEVERSKQEDAINDKEKRRKEIEEKLELLNERKHSLVQVLKQILSAEEQLKRQNSVQGTSGRPPLPLQVDTTTDTGSMSRANTPKMGPDVAPCGDMDGGEADDTLNPNNHPRHVPRMSSTSPSSDCQQRKPPPNLVPLTHRTLLGVAGSPSPSRFAPAGQVHSSVSVTGTNYIASSPSPAASGGTSVFRDGRLPSPWN
ncbi:hypothetical protein F511_22681 [Dorcoceras hygrometricum]|uniref:Uncharacterized protein n=1 Tax=Dorcoceras hygrometricum TaxID=472368 RepID=A0A2Z7BZG7_9LAMI|nr:hypothetical protein F511_22681 [Dorcoceras hygrometricum]